MSRKPKGKYARCYGTRCNKWLTLEETDRYYNEFKMPFCGECIEEARKEHEEEKLLDN